MSASTRPLWNKTINPWIWLLEQCQSPGDITGTDWCYSWSGVSASTVLNPLTSVGPWITLSWHNHYKAGPGKQLFPSLRLTQPYPKGVCVRACACACVCVCMCFLSTSFSSSTHGCCFKVSEIPIFMPFPSLITAAAVPLWSHFINKTCCQSDCKDSLTHFLANNGFNFLKQMYVIECTRIRSEVRKQWCYIQMA